MDFPMRCPNCGKRAFDTSGFHQIDPPVEISLKCPQCGRFIRVPIAQHMCLPAKKGGDRVQTLNP
jgi:DNA-directed RNA polymerase subunit RPC12/RpoP